MSWLGKAWKSAKDIVTPDKTPKSAQYTPNQTNFQYGLGANNAYTNAQSAQYDEQQRQLAALGDSAQNRQGPTQAMPQPINYQASGGQAYLTGADADARRQQIAALGGIQTAGDNLNQFAQNGSDATRGAIQQATDAAAHQQFGFARAQPGGGGAALRNAAFNAAGISGNAGNQAAIASQADRAQQLQALGAVQQGAGQLAGYAGQVRGADQAFAQAQAGQANYDAGAQNQFNQGQQQLEFNVGANNLQAEGQQRGLNDQTTLGTYGLSQGYDQQRNDLAAGNQAGNIGYEGAKQGGAQLAAQNFNAEKERKLSYVKAGLGVLSAGAGAAATASDIRAKKDIRPAPGIAEQIANAHDANARQDVDFNQDEFRSPGAASRIGLGQAGDARQARLQALLGRRDEQLETAGPSTAALDSAYQGGNLPDTEYPNLRPAQGFEYSYKDPGKHGEGRYVGPMAQDLEHLPGVVKQDPSGTKVIDAPRLTLANTAALSEIQRKQDEQDQRLRALGYSPDFARPNLQQPDYAALDGARYR